MRPKLSWNELFLFYFIFGCCCCLSITSWQCFVGCCVCFSPLSYSIWPNLFSQGGLQTFMTKTALDAKVNVKRIAHNHSAACVCFRLVVGVPFQKLSIEFWGELFKIFSSCVARLVVPLPIESNVHNHTELRVRIFVRGILHPQMIYRLLSIQFSYTVCVCVCGVRRLKLTAGKMIYWN